MFDTSWIVGFCAFWLFGCVLCKLGICVLVTLFCVDWFMFGVCLLVYALFWCGLIACELLDFPFWVD